MPMFNGGADIGTLRLEKILLMASIKTSSDARIQSAI